MLGLFVWNLYHEKYIGNQFVTYRTFSKAGKIGEKYLQEIFVQIGTFSTVLFELWTIHFSGPFFKAYIFSVQCVIERLSECAECHFKTLRMHRVSLSWLSRNIARFPLLSGFAKYVYRASSIKNYTAK